MTMKGAPRYPEAGAFLVQLRESKGLQQQAAAAFVKEWIATLGYRRRGGSNAGLSRYESGEQLPGPEVLWALSKVYGESLDFMFGSVHRPRTSGTVSAGAIATSTAAPGTEAALNYILGEKWDRTAVITLAHLPLPVQERIYKDVIGPESLKGGDAPREQTGGR